MPNSQAIMLENSQNRLIKYKPPWKPSTAFCFPRSIYRTDWCMSRPESRTIQVKKDTSPEKKLKGFFDEHYTKAENSLFEFMQEIKKLATKVTNPTLCGYKCSSQPSG